MMIKNLIIVVLIAFISSCGNDKSTQDMKGMDGMKDMEGMEHKDTVIVKKIYTCPMHPEIIRNAPGQCPICGMDLVEKKSDGKVVVNEKLDFLLKPTNAYVLSQVKTISPKQIELPIEINATGKITYDTREVSVVSARVNGRIEKLYIKYRFQPVEKGQKLMDIYSKDLVTEQENFIYLLKGDAENKTIVKTAENRLILQGLTEDQINELKKTKKPIQSVTIYSPYSGHLHQLSSSSESNNMNSMNKINSEELTMKEGMYVQKGQTVFNIYNTKKVWAILSIYSDKVDQIKTGQKVKIKIDDETSFNGTYTIDFIEPEIKTGENTVPVRVYISNADNNIKIGSNVKGVIEAGTKKGLFIPSDALVHLGNSAVVFVKENELLKAQQVQIGIESNNWVEVISGLTEKDIVAENAQLLIDSESFIKIENK